MKRVIFFDIDGTLIDCANGINSIRPDVEKEIRKLQMKGNYIFVATGRSHAFIPDEILNFGFDGFVLTNGNLVTYRDKVIYRNPLKYDCIKNLLLSPKEFNVQYSLQGYLNSYLARDYKEMYEYYYGFGMSEKYLVREFDIDEVEFFKVDLLCMSKEAVSYCLTLENSEVEIDYDLSKSVFEFYAKQDSKGTGAMKVLQYLDISVENSYAFGDARNDIEMINMVGCGITMGNASDLVKNQAKRVTDTVLNDGVAVGIREFIDS